MKTRGWFLAFFSTIQWSYTGLPSRVSCIYATANTDICIYDWQVRHVRAVSDTQDFTNNYNTPSDAHMSHREVSDLFGVVNGVGKCAQRCPSSGE